MTSAYTKINLADVKDLAPEHGMGDYGQSRFARTALGAKGIGLAHYRVNPGQRIGFGHTHHEAEEVYLVLSGSGRFKVDDDVFDVGPQDLVYCPPGTVRAWEAGDEGMELVAFGHHTEDDSEMEMGWWSD
jgi:mannose-6-phosphate isomerase-like protein (cupin superfamily)